MYMGQIFNETTNIKIIAKNYQKTFLELVIYDLCGHFS
jgi:hypothetical protein